MKINRPTDLRAPGAIDALLAFHRATFGASVMEDTGSGEAGGDGAGAPAPDGAAEAAQGRPGETPEQTIAGLREALAKANEQAKNERLKATGAKGEVAEAIAKALGLKPEDVSDTDKLAGQVTGLSEKLEQLTRSNLELSVLNAHPDLSDEDKAVVKKIPDEATMRAVAARLAEASKPSGKPKADPPSQGGGSPQIPADKPGLPRLRAAYEAAESN